MLAFLLKSGILATTIVVFLYAALLGLLTTQWFQTHVVYLHGVQMTWFKDLNVPEMFGFLHNQVTPFHIRSAGSPNIYAWHILPLQVYRKHEGQLIDEAPGFSSNFHDRLAFSLLRDDPDACLVIHMHGAGGTVASGFRTPNYRALSAALPDKLHVLTFDYRGFGRTPGTPSEDGIIADAISVVDWALNFAKVPPSRIVIFSQSLGTAVNIAVANHFAHRDSPVVFAGHILVAPFVDVPTLVATYRIAGTIPLLGPLARFPTLFRYLKTFIQDKWSTKDRITEYIRENERRGSRYQVTIIHAQDDYDIPWQHSLEVFRHAVNGTRQTGYRSEEFEDTKSRLRRTIGSAGSVVDWKTDHGIIREEILKYGLHDVIMGCPVISMAVWRMLV